MSTVRLWLTVCEAVGPYALWTKELTTDFLPRKGDLLHLSYNYEDDEDDCAWYVAYQYWTHSGACEVRLEDMSVDDTSNRHRIVGTLAPWNSEYGRPEPMLRRGGWITYEDHLEARPIPDLLDLRPDPFLSMRHPGDTSG